MSAELAARRTAAAAVLAGYLNGPGTADPGELSLWAARLADVLSHVLAVLDAADKAAAQFPAAAVQLAEISLVLDAFDWEADDRQFALEQIDDIANREPGVKALAVILAVLLVLAHPAAAAAVLGAELAVCGVLGWLAWRSLRAYPYPYWRTA